jgi:two-component system invasion response regulator UvrY
VSTAGRPIDLFFVEDSAVFRSGLLCWAEAHDDLRVKGAAGSAEEALPVIFGDPPDVVILDLGLPGMSGIDALRAIKRARRQTRVVVVTLDDSAWARSESGLAGADAFVSKAAVVERLYDAIIQVTSVLPVEGEG